MKQDTNFTAIIFTCLSVIIGIYDITMFILYGCLNIAVPGAMLTTAYCLILPGIILGLIGGSMLSD